jgi:hypothetical protein
MKQIKRCNWVNIEFKDERFKVRALLMDCNPGYLVKVEIEGTEQYGTPRRTVRTKVSGFDEALEKFGKMVNKIKNSPDRFEYL